MSGLLFLEKSQSHPYAVGEEINIESERISDFVIKSLHEDLKAFQADLASQAKTILDFSEGLRRYNVAFSKIESAHFKVSVALLCTIPIAAATLTGIYVPYGAVVKVFSAIGSFCGGSWVGGGVLYGGNALIQSQRFERWMIGDKGAQCDAAAERIYEALYPNQMISQSDYSFSTNLERTVNLAHVILNSCNCLTCCEDFCDRNLTSRFIHEGLFNSHTNFQGMEFDVHQKLMALFIKAKLVEWPYFEIRKKQRREEIEKETRLLPKLVDLCISYLCPNARVNPTGDFCVKVQNHLRDVHGHELEAMVLEDHDLSRYSRTGPLTSVSEGDDLMIWVKDDG